MTGSKYRVVEFTPENVRMFRQKMGMTQKQFAEKIGFTQPEVSMAERDRRRLSLKYINAMQEAFNLKITKPGFADLKPREKPKGWVLLWLKARYYLGLYDKSDVTPATFEAFLEMDL